MTQRWHDIPDDVATAPLSHLVLHCKHCTEMGSWDERKENVLDYAFMTKVANALSMINMWKYEVFLEIIDAINAVQPYVPIQMWARIEAFRDVLGSAFPNWRESWEHWVKS